MMNCERVKTENGKVEYCNDRANWITPPGEHTGRVINVCTYHKKRMINRYGYKAIGFQRL